MGAFADIWKSERGLMATFLLVAVTVLACMGQVTFAEWREYTLYIYGTYAVTKTITGVVTAAKGGSVDPEQAATTTTVKSAPDGSVSTITTEPTVK